MEDSVMIKYIGAVICTLVIMSCAGPLQFIDKDRFAQNQDYRDQKEIVVRTDIEDILNRKEQYKDVFVEISAPVVHIEQWRSPMWHFILEQKGKQLYCYERNFHNEPDYDALPLLRRAKHENGNVTVMGQVKKDGLELLTIGYEGFIVHTNLKNLHRKINRYIDIYNSMYY